MTQSMHRSVEKYERWLSAQLAGELVKKDLKKKHKRMREGPFAFLRATYWRWAETIFEICPELQDGAQVLAVGDAHLENFGIWRDAEGRLVFGVNDFDEAARMPYMLDLVRLAVSAALAPVPWRADLPSICAIMLGGYRHGLNKPKAFVLEREHGWLRRQFEVDETERAAFWTKVDKDRADCVVEKLVPEPYRSVLRRAMPEPSIPLEFWARSAGTGSLGRPRWVAHGHWRGASVLRETKAVLPSAWTLTHRGSAKIRCEELATGRFRAPDPLYHVKKNTVVRRLSPNSRKLETTEHGVVLLTARMLRDMGHELANIQLGAPGVSPALAEKIEADIEKRERGWLPAAAEKMAAALAHDQQEWASG